MAFRLTLETHDSLSDSSFILIIGLFHKYFWGCIMNITLY